MTPDSLPVMLRESKRLQRKIEKSLGKLPPPDDDCQGECSDCDDEACPGKDALDDEVVQ